MTQNIATTMYIVHEAPSYIWGAVCVKIHFFVFSTNHARIYYTSTMSTSPSCSHLMSGVDVYELTNDIYKCRRRIAPPAFPLFRVDIYLRENAACRGVETARQQVLNHAQFNYLSVANKWLGI